MAGGGFQGALGGHPHRLPVMHRARTGQTRASSRDLVTGIDVGLRDLFADKALSEIERTKRLRKWTNRIQWEIVSMEVLAVCTLWHPEACGEMVRPLVRGKVLEITAAAVEEVLSQVPPDIHTPEPEIIRVVVLRSSREVMETLRTRGWHSGQWWDSTTGQDNGVRRLFAATQNSNARHAGLQKIIHTLHDELLDIPNGVVTLWHDEITLDLVTGENVDAIEITATSADEALAKLKEAT